MGSSLRLSALDMELEAFVASVPGGWKSCQNSDGPKLFARGEEILGHMILCEARTCCYAGRLTR